MALSRIWSAFVIIAILVAGYKWIFNNDETIFTRMVVGRSDDAYEYYMIGSPSSTGYSADSFAKKVEFYGYKKKTKPEESKFLIADDLNADSIKILKQTNPQLRTVTYSSVLKHLQKPVDGILRTCVSAVMDIILPLVGILALFMGFMSIAEKAGGIRFLSRIIGPFFSRLFPELPKNHPAMGHMMMNFSANLLGLDNAATPFGIKAMESLQELNPNKTTASNAQLMFLCLHASGLTLIPLTIIADRVALRASNPTDIFVPCMIASFIATITAMSIVAIKQRINIFQPVIIAWIGGISALIALLVWYITSLSVDTVQLFSGALGNGILLAILFLIVLGGIYKKINVFDAFIEGAKGGFETALRIIPYLVGLLVAISMLRSSGTFDAIILGLKNLFAALGTDTKFVDGLPTALLKPVSGSGARAMMIDTMKITGPDSFASKLAGIFRGSSETTFYVVAVYFGAVSIKNTRYAIGTMLLADLVGIIISIILAYMFFG